MDKKTVNAIITVSVIAVGLTGIGYVSYRYLVQKPKTTTDPLSVSGWDNKIQALLNKRNTYSQTEQISRIKTKLTQAEQTRLIYLVKQFNDRKNTMPDEEKESLYMLMNLTFGS